MSLTLRCSLRARIGLLGLILLCAYRGAAQAFGPVIISSTGVGSTPLGIALGDINGDGRPDLLAAIGTTSTVRVGYVSAQLGAGDGTFGSVTVITTGLDRAASALKLVDLNRDGKLDLVVASATQAQVLLGKGDGTFGASAIYALLMSDNTHSLAVADLNSDSQLDIVVVSNVSERVSVLLGKPDGSFATAATYATGPGSQPQAVAVGDVNADGYPDLITTDVGGNRMGCLLGKGDGTLGAITTYANSFNTAPYPAPSGVALGDVNGDGRLDIVSCNNTGIVDVLAGAGDGTFAVAGTYTVGPSPVDLVLGDVNGDGILDVATANFNSDNVSVLLGKGDASFRPASTYSTGRVLTGISGRNGTLTVALADLNGDGSPDLVEGNNNAGTVGVFLNQTPPLLTISTPSEASGARLTLSGTRLQGATSVTFSRASKLAAEVLASHFSSTDYSSTPNTISLQVPLGLASGLYTVAVTLPGGTSPRTSFTVTTPLSVVGSQLSAGLSLYPNPSSATTTLTGAPAGSSIQVLDAVGQVVAATTATATGVAKLPALARGLYLVRTGSQATRLLVP